MVAVQLLLQFQHNRLVHKQAAAATAAVATAPGYSIVRCKSINREPGCCFERKISHSCQPQLQPAYFLTRFLRALLMITDCNYFVTANNLRVRTNSWHTKYMCCTETHTSIHSYSFFIQSFVCFLTHWDVFSASHFHAMPCYARGIFRTV